MVASIVCVCLCVYLSHRIHVSECLVDLSFNQLRGRIPEDWAIQGLAMIRLRHLYLDHNRFTGPLPSILPTIGNSTCSCGSLLVE